MPNQQLTTIDTPTKRRWSPPPILTSYSLPKSMPSYTHGHPIGNSMKKLNGRRQERYDPCCSIHPQTPTRHAPPTRSFDTSGNRTRRHSEYNLNPSSPFSLPHERLHNKNSTHNRRRAYSSGPIIGTTVIVMNSSAAAFDCDESSEGTMSSLEEGDREKWATNKKALSAMTLPDLPTREMIDTNRRTKSVPVNIQNTEISSYRSRTKSRTASFLNLLPPCIHSAKIPPLPPSDKGLNHSNSRKQGMRSRLPTLRLILHLAVFASFGIILFSTSNPTSDTHGVPKTNPTIRDIDMGDIRTVKNFSGEWGLTLTDTEIDTDTQTNEAAESSGRHSSGKLRKKRQPRLAEANSLSTQHLSFVEAKQFVLTDDEIRQKTKKLGDNFYRKNRRRSSYRKVGKEAANPIYIFAWIFLILAGINSAWRPISGWLRRLDERDSSTSFPPSLSHHAHYR